MKIGRYDVHLIDAGRFRLDGGAMFGVVPRVLWENKMPPDESNRIQLGTNVLLLQGDNRVILIDCGMGDKGSDKFRAINAVDQSEHNLHGGLQRLDIAVEQITDVILTHLHYDHAGGATRMDEQGNIVATFPEARYYVQKEHFGWAMKPSEKDRASFLKENFLPLQENKALIMLDGEMELFPGIELLPIGGHTPAQQMVLVRGEGQSLLFAGDLIPTATHVSLPWIMAYDIDPLKTLNEKKHFLHLAEQQNWLVVFEHDPLLPCATIQATERGYALKDAVQLD